MGRIVKVGLILLVLVLAGAGWYVWRLMPKFPARPFTDLGPWPVATREFDWTDSARAEPFTRNPADRRRLTVQVWYPTIAGATGDTAPYLLRPDEFADRFGAKAARKPRTNSIYEGPIAAGDSAFPVLVYHHGGLWTRWSATFVTEWLASHGYVVFSVEHFGFNQTAAYADGAPYQADTLLFPGETGNGRADALASWAYLDNVVFGVWEADGRFVLDRIAALDAAGPFAGRLDLDRIGMLGWSFGGAVSIQLSATDSRVKAAVDHDGQLFGSVRETGTTRPVLQFHHGYDDALDYPEKDRATVRELIAMTEAADSQTRARSAGPWYEIVVAGTEHLDFSDLALFYPRKPERIEPHRGHELIRNYTLQFFDHYLRGRPAPLLAPGAPPPAELTIRTARVPADSTA
ncbi:MAG: alpha/beta hydrolase family protein [Gemmatimonadales bacterium]